MTAHTNLPQVASAGRPTTPGMTQALRSCLASGAAEDAIQRIADTPALLSEATMALPALRVAATAPARPDGVRRVIKARFEMFPQPERSDEGWALWWRDYVMALSDLPEESLEMGMAAWMREKTSQFLPKPGELRELARTQQTRGAEAYRRAREAAELARRRQAPRGQRADPEDVKAMMAQFRAGSLARRSEAKPERDPILDMDPDLHDVLCARQRDQTEAAMEWATLNAAQLHSDAKPEDRQALKDARVAAYRKMADAMDSERGQQ